MNEPSFTPEQIEKMLGVAAARLGTTPDALRTTFRQGGLKGLSDALSPQQAAQAEAMTDGQAQQLLRDPAIQRLLIQLLGQ